MLDNVSDDNYIDKYGRHCGNRRRGTDRRTLRTDELVQHERRTAFRRRADRERLRDNQHLIDEGWDGFREPGGKSVEE